jgi:hypothetical protein
MVQTWIAAFLCVKPPVFDGEIVAEKGWKEKVKGMELWIFQPRMEDGIGGREKAHKSAKERLIVRPQNTQNDAEGRGKI